jgi:hypothetical protein
MLRIQHSTQVLRPAGRVWAVFEDLPAWPRWNPVTPAVQWLTEGVWRRGARMRITLRLGVRRMLLEPEVVEVEPDRRVTWVGRRFGLRVRQIFAFEPDEGGTRVVTTETLSGPLLFFYRIVMPAARIRTMLVRWLEALKAEAER